MMNLAVGSSSRRCAIALAGLGVMLLGAATFAGSAHATSSIFGTTGTTPTAITVDSAGNIYTANWNDNNVSKITPDGTSTILGTTGVHPDALTIDSAGNVFTSNIGSNRVWKITPDGTSTLFGSTGAGSYAITADSAGNIYTASWNDNNVTKFTPSSYPAPPARPAAPAAVAGNGQVTVAVTANPKSAAFGAPSSYTVTAVQDASKQCTLSFLQSTCVVSGLTNGTAYTFTSKAKLAIWQTTASAPSNSVTPTSDPTPNPTPDPTPDPTPNPTPDPTPDPTPNPTPDPTPNPTPNPTPGPDVGVSINNGAEYTNSPNVHLNIVWPLSSTLARISNDGGFANAQNRALTRTIAWRLSSSGPERLPKTVYVRFPGSINASQSFTDDIILDQTAPKIASATMKRTSSSRGLLSYAVALRGLDQLSGVAYYQTTTDRSKPGALTAYKRYFTYRSRSTNPTLYLRVRDKAGNNSGWTRLRAGKH